MPNKSKNIMSNIICDISTDNPLPTWNGLKTPLKNWRMGLKSLLKKSNVRLYLGSNLSL
jgi:hypothetical protein